jgi:G3E family GTPase
VTQLSAAPAADPIASRLPVTVITGFLGSGKTTLLRRLLRHPGMNRAAVVINEFGDVALDHELVEASSEQVTLLGNGCLCCTMRSDLQQTLRDLFIRRRAGEVIDFDRVFVETTGLADPVPVLHTLQTDGLLAAQFRLDGVVTLVDAVNGAGQLDTMREAARQAAVADRLVITKTDLSDAATVERLRARLAAMNAFAPVITAVNGELDPELLTGIAPRSARAGAAEIERWLQAGSGAKVWSAGSAPAPANAHDADIHSFCLWFDEPFTWDGIDAVLKALTALRGPDLLRVKGIVHIAGEPGPIVLQGAQHLIHPPVPLEAVPGTDPRSRIVFIVRGIPRASVEALFAAMKGLGT